MNNLYFLERYAKDRQKEIERETPVIRQVRQNNGEKKFGIHRSILRHCLLIFK